MIQKINVDIDTIKRNAGVLRSRIDAACASAGRDPDEITTVCVTKYVYPDVIAEMYRAGFRTFGENRVDEILSKEDYCRALGYDDIGWHLIGHLQSNKVNKLAGRDYIIHSCDTLDILRRLNSLSARDGVRRRVMLEFNISGEESKSGFSPDEMGQILDVCPGFKDLEICGLMTMAPQGAEIHSLCQIFGTAHKMCIDIASKRIDNMPMTYLSMGMSEDFEIAIAEGANMLRIGSTFYRGQEI